jgi:hypothetical protein
MSFQEIKRILTIIRNIFYSVDYNFVLAMSLSLIFMQGLQFIQGKTDDDTNQDILTNNLLIYLCLMVAFIGGISNTSFMLQNWEDMQTLTADENDPVGKKKNTFQRMTKGDIVKAIAITIPPLTIAWAGASEFLDTQFPTSTTASKAVRIACGLLVLSAAPGEFFTYGPGFLEKERLAIDAVRKVFTHPQLYGKRLQKTKYIGLFIGQLLSNTSDNLPEIFALKEILKALWPTFVKQYPWVAIGLGSVIALAYATFEANNEIGAVFREIAQKLDNPTVTLHESDEIQALRSINDLDTPPPLKYSLGVKTVANLLTGINCLCYMSSSSLLMPLIGTLSGNKIPFTKEKYPDNYYLLNMGLLAIPMLAIGGFSAYGQWKTVNPATQGRIDRVAKDGVKSLLTFGLWKPKAPVDPSFPKQKDSDEETRLLNNDKGQFPQYDSL